MGPMNYTGELFYAICAQGSLRKLIQPLEFRKWESSCTQRRNLSRRSTTPCWFTRGKFAKALRYRILRICLG